MRSPLCASALALGVALAVTTASAQTSGPPSASPDDVTRTRKETITGPGGKTSTATDVTTKSGNTITNQGTRVRPRGVTERNGTTTITRNGNNGSTPMNSGAKSFSPSAIGAKRSLANRGNTGVRNRGLFGGRFRPRARGLRY